MLSTLGQPSHLGSLSDTQFHLYLQKAVNMWQQVHPGKLHWEASKAQWPGSQDCNAVWTAEGMDGVQENSMAIHIPEKENSSENLGGTL